jgi:hypothetical protein
MPKTRKASIGMRLRRKYKGEGNKNLGRFPFLLSAHVPGDVENIRREERG